MQTILDTAADLLYPRVCVGCGVGLEGDDRNLCWDCRATVSFVRVPFCSCCGRAVEGAVDALYVCHACAGERPLFDLARSAASYDGVVKRMIHDYKYNHALWLERDMAELIQQAARVHLDGVAVDAIVPVPLHPVRERSRGYNQSNLLAKHLEPVFGVKRAPGLLRRVRPTPSQTDLTARERVHNVMGAFEAKTRASMNLRILLFDDVMTTGATLNECARALKEAGATAVYVLTLARGGWTT